MWVRSSKCDTNACVEVKFVKSSQCAAGECVEVAIPEGQDLVIVRSSQSGDSVVFTKFEWGAFIEGAKRGEFDVWTHATPSS